MNKYELPVELLSVVGGETIDFALYSERKYAPSYFGILFALFFMSITLTILSAILIPLFKGRDVRFKVNGEVVIANLDNQLPVILFSVVLILFIIGMVHMFIKALRVFHKKGGYYVSTKSRLINYLDGKTEEFNWKYFKEELKVDFKKNNIQLFLSDDYKKLMKEKLRTNKIPLKLFEPCEVYFQNVNNIHEVEKICRQRINENG